jgi:hypothetical protein
MAHWSISRRRRANSSVSTLDAHAPIRDLSTSGKLLLGFVSALVQELAERQYADSLVCPKIQHCAIAGHNDAGTTRYGALKDAVVRFVIENC